jgi:hypothetical protein
MELTREQARRVALDHLASMGPDWALCEDDTQEKPYGWIFGWTSKRYLETRRLEDAVAGNGPFLVERDGGRVVQFGSGAPAAEIADYEEGLATQGTAMSAEGAPHKSLGRSPRNQVPPTRKG